MHAPICFDAPRVLRASGRSALRARPVSALRDPAGRPDNGVFAAVRLPAFHSPHVFARVSIFPCHGCSTCDGPSPAISQSSTMPTGLALFSRARGPCVHALLKYAFSLAGFFFQPLPCRPRGRAGPAGLVATLPLHGRAVLTRVIDMNGRLLSGSPRTASRRIQEAVGRLAVDRRAPEVQPGPFLDHAEVSHNPPGPSPGPPRANGQP